MKEKVLPTRVDMVNRKSSGGGISPKIGRGTIDPQSKGSAEPLWLIYESAHWPQDQYLRDQGGSALFRVGEDGVWGRRS